MRSSPRGEAHLIESTSRSCRHSSLSSPCPELTDYGRKKKRQGWNEEQSRRADQQEESRHTDEQTRRNESQDTPWPYEAMTAPTTGASRIAPPTTFGPVDRSHRSKPATTVTVQATAMPTSRSGGEGCRACFGLSATAHLQPVAGPTCRRPGADGAYIVPVSQARIGSERTLLTLSALICSRRRDILICRGRAVPRRLHGSRFYAADCG